MKSTTIHAKARPSTFSNDPPLSTDVVVDKVQRLIATLETYHQKVMKKKVRLSEIQSIINEMTAESQSLSEVSKQLSATDRLRSIVNQSLILSSAEILKFNSGFYNKG